MKLLLVKEKLGTELEHEANCEFHEGEDELSPHSKVLSLDFGIERFIAHLSWLGRRCLNHLKEVVSNPQVSLRGGFRDDGGEILKARIE